MIESKKGEVIILGSVSELLADLSAAVGVLIENTAGVNADEKSRLN